MTISFKEFLAENTIWKKNDELVKDIKSHLTMKAPAMKRAITEDNIIKLLNALKVKDAYEFGIKLGAKQKKKPYDVFKDMLQAMTMGGHAPDKAVKLGLKVNNLKENFMTERYFVKVMQKGKKSVEFYAATTGQQQEIEQAVRKAGIKPAMNGKMQDSFYTKTSGHNKSSFTITPSFSDYNDIEGFVKKKLKESVEELEEAKTHLLK